MKKSKNKIATSKTKAAAGITHIKDLTPCATNAREHTPRGIGFIERSLEGEGAGRSILIDERGEIIAGHGVVEAAGNVGIEKVRVVEADGNEIIAVMRRGLTEEQKAKLRLADNRSGDVSTYSYEHLMEENKLVAVGDYFFEEELKKCEDAILKSASDLEKSQDFSGPTKDAGAAEEQKKKIQVEHTCPACGYHFKIWQVSAA